MDTPFNMMIVGMTNCGKTYYLLEMLEKDYKGYLDYIVLICPTFSVNKTYQDWKYVEDKDFITIECDHKQVNRVLYFVSKVYGGTNSLIIIDDCAASKDVKNRMSELVKLAFSARHLGLSTIVITQQLTSISKPYRDNVSKIVTFYNPNKHDMAVIFENFLDVSRQKENDIKEKLKENKYARLEISLVYPYSYEVAIPQK